MENQQASTISKVIALSSFVILIIGFVAYRSGLIDFSQLTSSTVETSVAIDAPQEDAVMVVDTPPTEDLQEEMDRIIPSSKSGVIFEPDPIPTEPAEKKPEKEVKEDESPKRMMGGSKSFEIFPVEEEAPALNAAPASMGSSKSKAVFTPRQDTTLLKVIMGGSKSDEIIIIDPEPKNKKD